MITTEKRFEADIESFFLSPAGGYTKGADTYDAKQGLYVTTLIDFVQRTQPKEWARFENANQVDPVRKFCTAFNTACETEGLLSVLRHGFKHRGLRFRVCYFKPESALNQAAAAQWAANTIECYRQWYFSADTKKSVDMVLVLNGIPVFAFELKNQYTGQTVDDAKRQWMYDRDPRELCFQFNKRILAYFCVDHTEVWMTTKLAGKNTYFLPFNQGSNGGQSGKPQRLSDGVSLGECLSEGQYDGHCPEVYEPEGWQNADFSALSSAGCGAQAAGRCGRIWYGAQLPDSA